MKMYILVNEDIKISKGKLAGQVGHAVCSYMYDVMMENLYLAVDDYPMDYTRWLEEYMELQKKIILKCPQSKLEELEKVSCEERYSVIRDKGLTELEPNTLTCVNIGIFNKDNTPEWVKELKLYH